MSFRYVWVLLLTVASFTASAQDYSMLPEFVRLTGIYKSSGIHTVSVSIATGNVPQGQGGTLYSQSTLNADGQEIKTLFYRNGLLFATSTYEFSNGKRTTMHQTFNGNSYEMWQTYLYDSTGRLVSITEKNNANTNLTRVVYAYEAGRLSQMKYYSATGPDVSLAKWTYSSRKESFQYDELGRLSSVSVETPEADFVSDYAYDPSGRLATVMKYDVYYIFDMADYQLIASEKYQFHADGTLDRIIITDTKTKAEETTIYAYSR